MSKSAIIIGNSHYDNKKIDNLKGPSEDVKELEKVFSSKYLGGFNEVVPLIDKSKSDIENRIDKFVKDRLKSSLTVLYLSGHGILDLQNNWYFAARNTQPDFLKSTGISKNFLLGALKESSSGRKVLILDCCFSGAVIPNTKSIRTTITEDTFGGYGLVVLTATSEQQYAYDQGKFKGKATPSLFTSYFLEGIKTGEADANQDNSIDLHELYEYVYNKVSNTSKNLQKPLLFIGRQEGKAIVISKSKTKPPNLTFPSRSNLKVKALKFPSIPPQLLFGLIAVPIIIFLSTFLVNSIKNVFSQQTKGTVAKHIFYNVNVGGTLSEANSAGIIEKEVKKICKAKTEIVGSFYRVHCGPYNSFDKANDIVSRLKDQGYAAIAEIAPD